MVSESIRPWVRDMANRFKSIELTNEEFIYLRSILEVRVRHECLHYFTENKCNCPCGCDNHFEGCICQGRLCGWCKENC